MAAPSIDAVRARIEETAPALDRALARAGRTCADELLARPNGLYDLRIATDESYRLSQGARPLLRPAFDGALLRPVVPRPPREHVPPTGRPEPDRGAARSADGVRPRRRDGGVPVGLRARRLRRPTLGRGAADGPRGQRRQQPRDVGLPRAGLGRARPRAPRGRGGRHVGERRQLVDAVRGLRGAVCDGGVALRELPVRPQRQGRRPLAGLRRAPGDARPVPGAPVDVGEEGARLPRHPRGRDGEARVRARPEPRPAGVLRLPPGGQRRPCRAQPPCAGDPPDGDVGGPVLRRGRVRARGAHAGRGTARATGRSSSSCRSSPSVVTSSSRPSSAGRRRSPTARRPSTAGPGPGRASS